MRLWTAGVFLGLLSAAAGARELPRPLPGHPGNVFLEGDPVAVAVSDAATAWRVLDCEGRLVRTAVPRGGRLELGPLPVGWYELAAEGPLLTNRAPVALAVLAPLRARTPADSPVALDVAMAWFYGRAQMSNVASLCALAGVNWVRDRLNWGEMEPRRNEFAPSNRYDDSARFQAAAGLRQLQVNHISPAWANAKRARFAEDLRDVHRFYREMAARWRGKIEAIEPWNEPDIEPFGGHTGSEIASFQKAAYLGLKAGNPRLIACQSVFALPGQAILEDFYANEPWPCFDTFNLHHYATFDDYPKVYGSFRAVSGGRPLWVTECSVPVKWSGDAERKEPSPADLRVQAERVAKVFATALHEGPATVFYFLLPHYAEGQTQFGIVRADLTPRPAYVALAAVGRCLAGARPLGRLNAPEGRVRAYLFRAGPDGTPRWVLVAWSGEGPARLALPRKPLWVLDHLGRSRPAVGAELELNSAPVFAAFPADASGEWSLAAPPARAKWLPGEPSRVVLQAVFPAETIRLARSAYRWDPRPGSAVPLRVYNFGSRPARGRLEVGAPPGWEAECPREIEAPAGGCAEVAVRLRAPSAPHPGGWVQATVRGDFGRAGRPVLAFRLEPGGEPGK